MGVDLALDGNPHDRFVESQAASAPLEEATPAPAPPPKKIASRAAPPPQAQPALPLAVEHLARSARESAAEAQTLEQLRERLEAFEGCGLKVTATRLVFGDGNPQANIMLIGEAPGADEDRQGIPFVGRAGQLLNAMLSAIGLDRPTIYIANIVPWRPPGNRTPTPVETAACLPFIKRQIELVEPKILICLGAPSAQTLLATKESITRLRGRWHSYALGETQIKALAMLHPAFLLRQPAQKRLAWQDLRMLAREIYAKETGAS
jgi:DNA polymerase